MSRAREADSRDHAAKRSGRSGHGGVHGGFVGRDVAAEQQVRIDRAAHRVGFAARVVAPIDAICAQVPQLRAFEFTDAPVELGMHTGEIGADVGIGDARQRTFAVHGSS